MNDELDIWRSAKLLVDRYGGEEALRLAAVRADSLLAQGDADGHAVWREILRAVAELTRTKRRADERVN